MSLAFNWAQTLYLDASLVGGATEVAITKVDLFFRNKPPATGNKSGIKNPGVELLIFPTRGGLPMISQIGAYRPTEPTEHGAKFAFYSGGQISRAEYEDVIASADGSVPTEFLLSSPAIVHTNQEYAIVVKFDGNENFILWNCRIGDYFVGTTKKCPGPSSNHVGNLFSFIGNPSTGANNSGYGYTNTAIAASTSNNAALIYTSQQNLGIDGWDPTYLAANWQPIPNVDLKFRLYVARYSHKGVPASGNTSIVANTLATTSMDRAYLHNTDMAIVSNNVTRLTAQVEAQEYLLFDRETSIRNELFYGETIFSNSPAFPGGKAANATLKVTTSPTGNIASLVSLTNVSNAVNYASRLIVANGSYLLPNGATFSAAGGFNRFFTEGTSICVTSANGSDHEIRYIEDIVANNIAVVDTPFAQSMTNATISIVPVGFINDISPSYLYGSNRDILCLNDSTANDSVRFVSNSLRSVTPAVGGSGYANSDWLRIAGYEEVGNGVRGNYLAVANLVTNSTGGITAVYLSNLGAGFVNSGWLTGANVTIKTSSAGVASNSNSAGTGATFTFDIGSDMLSEFSESKFANCQVINLDAVRMKPEITVNNPVGSAFTIKHRTLFYKTHDANTQSGYAYYVNTPSEQAATDTYAKIFKGHTLATNDDRVPVIPSRSNQFVIRYANGTVANTSIIGDQFSNSALFLFDVSSNNDYQTCFFDPEIINSHYANYIINQEYTGEHTNYGKAWAKHIMTKVNLNNDRFAEDLMVYLTAYRPVGSDIKVYAKIHNSTDSEEFDDKEWTLLDQIDGLGVYSSKDDSSDMIELTYNLPSYPNTEFELIGSATVQQGNAVVTGTNSQFQAKFNIIAGGTGYGNGDIVQTYPVLDTAPDSGIYALDSIDDARGVVTTNTTGGITAITVIDTGIGFTSQANVLTFAFSNSTGGSTSGTGANVSYKPGIAANDVVKIYSPYFPETNYTVVVVDAVANDTSFTIKRNFGDLSANASGTVTVNATSTEIVGAGTSFTLDFTADDFVAVWGNTTAYEVKQVNNVVNSTSMHIKAGNNFSIVGSGRSYAYVETDAFTNGSIAVADLKVDKVHYELQAFNNIQNDNVARYYSTSRAVFNGFDTFQIKLVMVSNNDINVPKVDDVRALAVTA